MMLQSVTARTERDQVFQNIVPHLETTYLDGFEWVSAAKGRFTKQGRAFATERILLSNARAKS